MSVSLVTVSAHNVGDDNNDPNLAASAGKDYASLTVELIEDEDREGIYPNTKLEFRIIVERTAGHTITGAVVAGPATDVDDTDDDVTAAFELDDGNQYMEFKRAYTISPADLGDKVSSRTVPLKWTLTFQAEGDGAESGESNPEHPALTVSTTIDIDVIARPGAGEGASEVLVDFVLTQPDEVAKGEKVKFAITVSTGTYQLKGKSVRVRKQLFDADDDEDGNSLPVASIAIPNLGSNAQTSALKSDPEEYKLLQREVEAIEAGGRLEFSVELVVNEADLFAGTDDITDPNDLPDSRDINGDGDREDEVEKIKISDNVAGAAEPEEEATPEPAAGMNEHATVVRDGTRIDITRTDNGEVISLIAGWISASGDSYFNPRGYIRDDDLGQTYAVVIRESDDSVVRVWIAPNTAAAGAVPWSDVLANYTVPVGVLSAITLDDMNPANDQLVRSFVGDEPRIYVYRSGAWRHIPDIPTFQAFGFYWCDITAADADFFDRVSPGNALPASGGSADPNYPSCHTM
jgi:hypothetical protein